MNQSTPQKSRGGVRPGSGRKKGYKSPQTLEKEAVLSAFRQRAMKVADKLLDAQLSIATGQSFLYCIRTVNDKREKPELITSEETISAYLNGDLDHITDEFYYITTKEPLNPAIDSIFDRTFGKSPQSLDVTSGGEKVTIAGFNYITPNGIETNNTTKQ